MKKAVVITGASSGIGAATALEFSANGYFVFLSGRNEKRLEKVAAQCRSGASLLKTDFTQPKTLEKYAKHVLSRPDVNVEVLINNAGIYQAHGFIEGGMKAWREQFEVNLFGAVYWTQLILPLFLKKKRGSIVNVSSTLGLKTTANTSAYSATKAAMNIWTQSLALELGPQGIRVNCVCPGMVDTPIHSFHSLPKAKRDKWKKALGPIQPLGRIGEPEEIAKSIYFLASADSAWTTGALLTVDGGINLT